MNSKLNPFPYEMFTVGFDDFFNKLAKTPTNGFPPYNILKTGDDSYLIEMAVAGFAEDDLSITVKDNILTIEGEQKETEMPYDYVHKGIATRNFKRSFTLAEHTEVEGAQVYNGILQLRMKKYIPEEQKPRQIPIGSQKPKEFLSE